MTETSLFLDSNIWIDYFLNSEFKEMIDSENHELFTSVICLHEICKKLKKFGKKESELAETIYFMQNFVKMIKVDEEVAILAVQNCDKHSLHTIDSLIYSSAEKFNLPFITADNDFRHVPKVQLVKK